MSDANPLSRLRRKIGLALGKEKAPLSPENMTDKDKVSEKWGKFFEEYTPDSKVKREFSLQHPTIQDSVCGRYLEGTGPFMYAKKYMKKIPSESALEIGCGGGYLSIHLTNIGVCSRVDAFDLSEKAVQVARNSAKAKGINTICFEVGDANTINLPKDKYDLILMAHSLHHVENLEGLFSQVNGALTDDGIFVVDDYVGPARMQWTEKQLNIINSVLETLPESYRCSSLEGGRPRKTVERIPLEVFAKVDPSEGVRSNDILPLAREMLDVLEVRPTGSTITYELLHGIIHNFDETSEYDDALLRLICLFEATLIREGILDSDFACFIAKKRR